MPATIGIIGQTVAIAPDVAAFVDVACTSGMSLARPLRIRSFVHATGKLLIEPQAALSILNHHCIQGVLSQVPPVKDHYQVFLRLQPTVIDGASWVLRDTGLVDNPLMQTLDDFRTK